MASTPSKFVNLLPIPAGRSAVDAVNVSFTMLFDASGAPKQVPAYQVPPGSIVRVRAHNGLIGGNQNIVTLTQYREAASGDVLQPNVEIIYNVNNTSQIWASGSAFTVFRGLGM